MTNSLPKTETSFHKLPADSYGKMPCYLCYKSAGCNLQIYNVDGFNLSFRYEIIICSHCVKVYKIKYKSLKLLKELYSGQKPLDLQFKDEKEQDLEETHELFPWTFAP